MAAVRWRGTIGTPGSLGSLLGLIEGLGVNYSPYLADALKGCGCEVRRMGTEWHYRLTGQDRWQVIR